MYCTIVVEKNVMLFYLTFFCSVLLDSWRGRGLGGSWKCGSIDSRRWILKNHSTRKGKRVLKWKWQTRKELCPICCIICTLLV